MSGHLQKEADFYSNFIEGGRTAKEFCGQVCIQPTAVELSLSSDAFSVITVLADLSLSLCVSFLSLILSKMQPSSVTKMERKL